MKKHRYTLEPYNGTNTRYHCPSCRQKNKTFSLYIDTETGEHLHPDAGRCNRESNCGYHYTPKQYFQDNNIALNTPQPKAYKPSQSFGITTKQKPITFIPVGIFKQSLQLGKSASQIAETNHFVKFLIDRFGIELTGELIGRYYIATSKHWNGATVFWQIDTQGKVRTGKIILYSPATGKRVKEPFNHINWVHKALKQQDFKLRQCFFGEHLLIDKTKPVAIVESEKTAVIASVYLPQFIWLACGQLQGLNVEKFSVLKNRIVALFPDLNGFEKWNSKAKELSYLAMITVSDLLELKATETERKQGLDLADYLIKLDWKLFKKEHPPEPEPPPPIEPPSPIEVKAIAPPYTETKNRNIERPEKEQPISWDKDIMELETYFASIELPTQPVKLNHYTTITDCRLFAANHLATIKRNNGKRTFSPYLERLHEFAKQQINGEKTAIKR